MLKWLTCLLTFCLAQANEPPFWKAKPKVYQRIENREIIVSVNARATGTGAPRQALRVEGGGQVAAPYDFVFATTQKYEDLLKSSDYIKSAKYNPETHLLDIEIEAFLHKAQMQIELKARGDVEPKRIEYRVVTGPLAGFAGAFNFVAIGERKTEVGISGDYSYDQFPIPRLFLEFGFEVVFQKMALRLRSYVEDQWHKSQIH
jgi:hypothetical protein